MAAIRLFAGAAIISFSGVFVKLVTVSSTSSAFWRVFLGGVILSLWTVVKRRPLAPRRPVFAALLLAALFFALDLVFWHQSIAYIGPGLATLLGNFQVFFMALAGVVLLHEHLRRRTLVAIPLAVFGLALVVGLDVASLSAESRLGITLGLLTALVYAGFLLSLRWAQNRDTGGGPGRDAGADLAVTCLLSALLLGLFALATGQSLAVASIADAGWLTLYALVSQVFGWVLITGSLSRVPPSRVGLILLAQPALAIVWDVLLFGRQFAPREAIGATLALTAIYLGSRSENSARGAAIEK